MPRLNRPKVALLAVAGILLAAPALAQQSKSSTGVNVTKPWARATPGSAKVGVAYLEISAPEGTADTLVAAKSPVAGVAELHTHAHENGVMKMRRVDEVAIAAGKTVVFKPGGYHIMLMDLKRPLKEGETIDVTLVFQKAGEVALKVPVLKVGSAGPGAKSSGSGGHGTHKH